MASLTTVETSYGSGSRPLGPLTWAALRAMDTSGLRAGDFVEVSDLNYSVFLWTGTLWVPRAPVLLPGSSAAPAAVTGTVAETAAATVTVPAGAMALNGGVYFRARFTRPNNANAHNMRVRWGGIAGSIAAITSASGIGAVQVEGVIRNRNSAASQLVGASGAGFVASATTWVTDTRATGAAVDLAFTVQLTTGADSITLESREVWLLP